MLRFALLAIGAAVLVALVFVLLPVGHGPRPDPRILSGGDAPSSTSFTIRDAAPPAPADPPPGAAAPVTPPAPGDLDAVMQRLRNAGTAQPTASATGSDPAAPATPTAPAAPVLPAVPATPPPPPAAPADAAPPAPPVFPTVTAAGTRWRMARSSGGGFTISIDMGSGHVADVHVLPAFANLDPAAINVRVDYLRETILQHFPHQSGSYSFARDGSVSLER